MRNERRGSGEERTVVRDEPLRPGPGVNCRPSEAETQLIDGLREDHAEAGHRFVRDGYPPVHRYLLYLTGHRETFLSAWGHSGQNDGGREVAPADLSAAPTKRWGSRPRRGGGRAARREGAGPG